MSSQVRFDEPHPPPADARPRAPGRRRLAHGGAIVALFGLLSIAPAVLAAEDDSDTSYVLPLVHQALETEKTDVEIPWSNPETGNRGIIVVERTFYRDEQPCRDYRRTVQGPGSPPVVIEGTGCRIGRGRWELDEEPPKEMSRAKEPPKTVSERPATSVQPAAGPAPEQPGPERSARPAAQPSASGAAEAAAEPEAAAAEPEAASEPEDAADAAPEAAPPKPPPFPDYTMPSAASL